MKVEDMFDYSDSFILQYHITDTCWSIIQFQLCYHRNTLKIFICRWNNSNNLKIHKILHAIIVFCRLKLLHFLSISIYTAQLKINFFIFFSCCFCCNWSSLLPFQVVLHLYSPKAIKIRNMKKSRDYQRPPNFKIFLYVHYLVTFAY